MLDDLFVFRLLLRFTANKSFIMTEAVTTTKLPLWTQKKVTKFWVLTVGSHEVTGPRKAL